MIPVRLPPILRGIDNLSDETALPEGAVREALNVLLDKDGKPLRRPGYERILEGNFHSIYKSEIHQRIFVMRDSEFGYLDQPGGVPAFTSLRNLGSSTTVDYTEGNNSLYAVNAAATVMVRGDGSVGPIGASLPDVPVQFSAETSGGMYEGTYTVAYSVVDIFGEESPLSEETQLQVGAGGGVGVLLPVVPGSTARLYLSPPNGEELYQAASVPLDGTTQLIGQVENLDRGRQPATRFLDVLPGGQFIASHKSRLLVARNDTVFYSEPFAPHLYSCQHGFIQFEGVVTMLQPVDAGVYISDSKRVYFLPGSNIEETEVRVVDESPAIYGTSTTVKGGDLSSDLQSADELATWLSTKGPCYGSSEGTVLRPAQSALEIPYYQRGSSCFHIHDGVKHVVFPVNSNKRDGFGSAVDSETF